MHTTLWGYMHLYYNSNVCNQQPEKESTDTDDLHTDHTLTVTPGTCNSTPSQCDTHCLQSTAWRREQTTYNLSSRGHRQPTGGSGQLHATPGTCNSTPSQCDTHCLQSTAWR